MSPRELVVLGTASQAPTKYRNHNGYLLRWDAAGILFDPGEGTQRQMAFANVSPPVINRICISHFHGDHCLGLPGVVQRLSLDRVTHPIPVHYPATGEPWFQRLRHTSMFNDRTHTIPQPVHGDATVAGPLPFTLRARFLDHGVDAVGWQLEEPGGRRMVPERLDAAGVLGPDIGRLQERGELEVGGRRVLLDDMSEPRPGQRFAFIMDTRLCDAAFELAERADLLVCEATFLERDERLARDYGHLTAAQAARIAAESGARRLVLTHFSQRYTDEREFMEEAGRIFDDVIVARDLLRIEVPRRRDP
jgi:ribonuclease Z